MELRSPRPHGAVEDVDLELAELDDWRKRHRVAVGAPHERDDPRQQLFGCKRNSQNVIDARLEGRELALEITSPRQTNHGQAYPADGCGSEQCHDPRTLEIHV